MAETEFKYDVFISYSSTNKEWVRKDLLSALEKAGLKACIDFRDFEIGKPSIKNMRDSTLGSKHTLLVLTDAYLNSGWTDFENLISQTLDPANREGRIVPLLLEKCHLPLELAYLTYVNFVDPEDWNIAWKQLLTALGKPDAVAPSIKEPKGIQPASPLEWFSKHPNIALPTLTIRAVERYLSRLKEFSSNMRVLYKMESVPLDELYVDLFVLDKVTASRRYDISQLNSYFNEKGSYFIPDEKRKSTLKIALEKDCLFILGKPGAGKTTLLKYLSILAVENKIHKIPIFVSLNEWAQSNKSLLAYIADQFESCGFSDGQQVLEAALLNGDGMLLLDGLDEISEEREQRNRVIHEVKAFTSKFLVSYEPKNKFFLTCRNAATEYVFEQFEYAEIADFTYQQVKEFVQKWFSHNPAKTNRFLAELGKKEHRNLEELSRTPLLLGLLCLVFDETDQFPAKQVDVYKDVIDALLQRWDKTKGIERDKFYRALSIKVKRNLLSWLAFYYFNSGTIFIDQDDLSKQIENYFQIQFLKENPKKSAHIAESIEGLNVLKEIEAQHGILVERAHRIYSFSHFTFQEYFAAQYIADRADDRIFEGLFSHFNDHRWREVFLFTTSLLPNADSFFERFLERINSIIKNDEEILSLLEWSNNKAMDYHPMGIPAIARMMALTLGHGIARTHIIDIERLLKTAQNRSVAETLSQTFQDTATLAFGRALDLDRQLALPGFEPNIGIGRALDFSDALQQNYSVTQGLALDVALYRTLNRIRDKYALEISLKLVLQLANDIKLDELVNSLRRVRIPGYRARYGVKEKYEAIFRKTIAHYRNIGHAWNLTEDQVKKLEDYINANIFLAECLNVATVSRRDKLESKLLLVPS
jgi:hypothetical protein